MAKIRIDDLPVDETLNQHEIRQIRGGTLGGTLAALRDQLELVKRVQATAAAMIETTMEDHSRCGSQAAEPLTDAARVAANSQSSPIETPPKKRSRGP